MLIVLVILVVLLLAGGGGFYGRRAGWGSSQYGLGLVLLVLLVIALIWAVNEATMPPVPMPAGTPAITR